MRKWTQKQERLLIKIYPSNTWNYIQKKLPDYTKAAIKKKAAKLLVS